MKRNPSKFLKKAYKYRFAFTIGTVAFFAIALTTVHVYLKYYKPDKPLIMENAEDVLNQLPKADPANIKQPRENVEGSMVLTFKRGTTDQQKQRFVESIGGRISTRIDALDVVVIETDSGEIPSSDLLVTSENDYYVSILEDSANTGELSTSRPLTKEEMEGISYEQANVVFKNKLEPEKPPVFNDPDFPDQWAMDFTNITESLQKAVDKDGLYKYDSSIVAVIDSGICLEHPDLEDRITAGYDFIENDTVPQDEMGHGCAVSGIIAANINNTIGITGAAPNTQIMPLKVINSQGFGKYSDLANAIIYAADHDAKIINISIGGPKDSELLKSAIEYAERRGVTIIAASGNTYSEEMLYPAQYTNVISVGSIDNKLFVSKFSSHSKDTDYFAPGESILSLGPDGSTKFYTGTSFAAPYVTSMIADGLIHGNIQKDKSGAVLATGKVLDVNFDNIDDVLGWGTSDYDPADVLDEVSNEFATAQSTTKCVTRYSEGWWAGAQCYIEGLWETNSNPSYQYQVYDSGYKYNMNYSTGSQYLGQYVRVEVTYTGQYSYGINSITLLNHAPIGDFNDVTDAGIAWGWAFDADSPSTSIAVHIYIDGPAGSGAPGFAVATNVYRSDVNAAYGISGNHGFSWQIPSPYNAGTRTFYVYAINAQGGSNPQISRSPRSRTFSVLPYNPDPSLVQNISSNIKNYGYFLPAGYNADILSEANQNISYNPHEVPEDPVNTATGYLDYSAIDLEYADVGGRAFEFRRIYNSDTSYGGILGVGWQASFDMKASPSLTNGKYGWTIIFPDGHGEIFYDQDSNYRTFEGTFTAASSESKGSLYRYGSDGSPYAYVLIYVDSQTGQQFFFRSDNNAGNKYGKLVQIQYPNGMKVNYNYDSTGKLTSAVEETYGRRFDFTIDASGRLTQLKDGANRTVLYTYNADGRLWKVTNPVGGITEYSYNGNNKISSVKDPNNITIASFTYDGSGRVIERKDGNGKSITYTYSTEGDLNVTTIKNQSGYSTIHKHNSKNYLVQQISPFNSITNYEYDDKGNRTKEISPDGKTYQFGYDSNGNRTSTTYPDGSIVTTEYNSAGKPTKILEANNERIKNFSYDAKNNLVSSTDANGKTTFYEYNANQLLSSITEASDYEKLSDYFGINQGWDSSKTVRTTGDVNGDGKDDIVGFGMENVQVALSDGEKFLPPQIWHTGYAYNDTWRVDMHPRMVADVNGDGKDDIVGFASSGVYVSLSTGSSFGTGSIWYPDFGYNQGWRTTLHVREAADVTGDGKADLVLINSSDVFVSKSTGTGFQAPVKWNGGYAYNDSWRVGIHPRLVADVNNDGKSDLIGFASAGPLVALSNGSSFVDAGTWISDFGLNQGWDSDDPRIMSDINGDGKKDIIGFGTYYVYGSLSTGSKFSPAFIIDRDMATLRSLEGQNPWWNVNYVRTAGNFISNQTSDLLGFAEDGVYAFSFKGNKKTFTYSSNGYLTQEKDQGTDAITTYQNDAVGNRTQIIDAEGNVSSITYNELGKKIIETDGRNHIKQYEYFPDGHLKKEIDEAGILTTYTYDGNYNLATKLVNNVQKTRYFYDFVGNPARVYDPESHSTLTAFDANRRPVRVQSYDKNFNLITTTRTSYNLSGTKASDTDANNNVTTYTYDSLGRLASESKDGKARTFTHDFWGNLISETDWNGNEYQYTYDKLDRKVNMKNPADIANGGPGTSYTYDTVGNIIKITDALGQETHQFFDSQKRLTKVVNSKGQIALYTYNKNGKLITQQNFAGETTTFTYDANGNLATKTDNLGNTTRYSYDARNLNTQILDAEGNTTDFTYDPYKNNITIVNAEDDTKGLTYDKNGNVLTITDEGGNVTTFVYDGLSRKTSETKQKMVNGVLTNVSEEYTYDGNDNIKTHKDGNNNTVTYNYDSFNNLIKATNPDDSEVSFAYDGNGNLLSKTDGKGATTHNSYDTMNNKISETDQENYTKTYTYDLLNRLILEKDAKNQETHYDYDSLGNVTKVKDRNNKETLFTYDNANRVLTVDYPNALHLENSYDGIGNKLAVTRTGTGLSSPVTESFTYDKLGNIKTQADAEGNVTAYNYDDLYRVTRIDRPLNLTVNNTYDKIGNLLSTTNENGRTTTYTYSPDGKVTKEKDPLNHETNYAYDANGNLIKLTDANNNETTFIYDELNRKTETKGPDSQTLEKLEYDNAGNISKKTDGNNNQTTFTYYLNDDLKDVVDPFSNTTSYEYDPNGNVTKQTNKLGKVVTYSYDPMDKLTSKNDEMGYNWTYTYDSVGNLLTVQDPKNRLSSNEYDALSRKTKTILDGGSSGTEETTYQYDRNGNLLKTVDPRGNSMTNTYDALNRLTKQENDQNEAQEFTYDGIGNVLSTKDAKGSTTTYQYDASSRKTSMTDPRNELTTYSYDNMDNLQFITKPNANQERYNYDNMNRVVEYIDGENNTTAYSYDNNGNLTSETKPNGTEYNYIYDALNRNVEKKATEAGENKTPITLGSYQYDYLDRLIKTSDAMLHDTDYAYDDLGRLTTVTDALSGVTRYTYDEVGNLLTEKNANNATTTYEYDPFDNRTKEIDAEGNIWQYEYDKNGNITKETDANSQVNERTYDKANRLLSKKYLNIDAEVQPESLYFEYDKNGNMTKAYKKDASGQINISNNFTFDSRSAITNAVDNRNYTQDYSYDANGNITSLSFPDGKTESYGYNENDKIISLTTNYDGDAITSTDPVELTSTFDYDANGNLIKQVNPDRTVMKKSYNYMDQVTGVNNYISTINSSDEAEYVLAKYDYTLNNNGQKLTADFYSNCDKTDQCAANIEVSTHDSYVYDALGRLTQAQRTIDNPTATIEKYSYTDNYTYDSVGNRTNLTTTQSGSPVTINYSYNTNNQLISESGENGTWTYTYDNNGNRLTKANSSTTEYVNNVWDRADNLVQVESKLKDGEGNLENFKVSYSYDALGRRITKTPDASVVNDSYANIARQDYVYGSNRWDMISEYTDRSSGYDVHTNFFMADLGSSVPSLIAAEDVQERDFLTDPSLWDRVADESSSEIDPEHNFIVDPDAVQKFAYYQRDALDTIVSRTNFEVRFNASDASGNFILDPTVHLFNSYKVNSQNRTDEYGKKLNDTISTPESDENNDLVNDWSSRGYSGQVYDIESRTYYYGSRNYDPQNGTWTKLDSYRGEFNRPSSRNRYSFVEDDPVNQIDEYGYKSARESLLKLAILAYKHPKEVKAILKDPKRALIAGVTYIGTYAKTKNIQAAKNAAHIVMTNNQQYKKVYESISKTIQVQKNKEEIDSIVKEQISTSLGLPGSCLDSSSIICSRLEKEIAAQNGVTNFRFYDYSEAESRSQEQLDINKKVANQSGEFRYNSGADCLNQTSSYCVDSDKDGVNNYHENLLMYTYSPELRLDKNEKYFPASAQWILENSSLKYRKSMGKDENFGRYQSWSELLNVINNNSKRRKAANFYLDIDNIKRTGSKDKNDWAIYTRVYRGKNGKINVQYWYSFPYNSPSKSRGIAANHEGEWEHITLTIGNDNIPTDISYAAHNKSAPGVTYCWEGCGIIKVGQTHPAVFIAEGTHASYVSDEVLNSNKKESRFTANGIKWEAWEQGSLVNLGEVDSPSTSLLMYPGKWGESNEKFPILFPSSPYGPAFQKGWNYDK